MIPRGIIIASLIVLAAGCSSEQNAPDAYGNFESNPVLVAAEAQGNIIELTLEEGQKLNPGQKVGSIDTMQLHLKKNQLSAGMKTLDSKWTTLQAQLKVQEIQLENLQREYDRVTKLLQDGAATQKQKEDLEGNIRLIQAQISSTKTQAGTINAERKSIESQVAQVSDQIQKATIMNPIKGVVLQKYKQKGEIIAPGQAIYKIANLETLYLRGYISGKQLASFKIGESLTVRYDSGEELKSLEGVISWISSEAEFTPKIIQTREERVNLVYAIKIRVENDGSLKIGMPGEIIL